MRTGIAFAFLVVVACLNFCQAEKKVTSQSKKHAQAVLNSIMKSLITDKSLTQDDDDDGLKMQDVPDSLLLAQGGLPKIPKLAEAANHATLQKFAKAQGYVKIPYYIWKQYWPLYYYSYYRWRTLRLIHKGY